MIREYEGQNHRLDSSLKLMREGDTSLTLKKYLVYDNLALVDMIFAEQDRRQGLQEHG